jgi:uncharacterized membrane protein YkvA (DUF1232 family)
MATPRLREWARRLKCEVLTVYYAARHPETPLLVRLLALSVAAYALSPIDLIPDFIPVLGYLDDLLLVPLGIWLVLRLLPASVLQAARGQAQAAANRPVSRGAAAVIVLLWAAALAWGAWLGYRWLRAQQLVQADAASRRGLSRVLEGQEPPRRPEARRS